MFEDILTPRFPNLMKCIKPQIQRVLQTPSWISIKKAVSIVKLLNYNFMCKLYLNTSKIKNKNKLLKVKGKE